MGNGLQRRAVTRDCTGVHRADLTKSYDLHIPAQRGSENRVRNTDGQIGRSSGPPTLANANRVETAGGPWIGRLLTLGSRAARWSKANPGRQLVIAVSVPVRDYAATVIGCGLRLSVESQPPEPVLEVTKELSYGTFVKVVTTTKVLTDYFRRVDLGRQRLVLGTSWQLEKVSAVVPMREVRERAVQELPTPGPISKMAGLHERWVERMCERRNDLAVVGCRTRLREDMAGFIGRGSELEPIDNLLMLDEPAKAATSTTLLSNKQIEDERLEQGYRAVVLDGASATRQLAAIDSPVVVAVMDRSVVDESAAELVLNYRNTRGTPLNLRTELQWAPIPGIEALGFSVSL